MSWNILKIDFDQNRIYGLDILRAVAVIFVLIAHGSAFLPKPFLEYYKHFFYDGVSIFFVLSGFLIGGILIKILEKNEATFRTLLRFWKRRWFRTLPNYFLVLCILIGIHTYLELPRFKMEEAWSYFIFCQNFASAHPSFFPEAWSLSVEEWFYLIVPILIFLMVRLGKITPRNAVLATAVLIIILVTGFRFWRHSTDPIKGLMQFDSLFRKQVLTRLDSIMYGVLGAYLAYYHKALWLRYKKPLFIIGILLIIFGKYSLRMVPHVGFNWYMTTFYFVPMSVGVLFLIPLLSQLRDGSGFVYKSLTYISLISYSLYLINLSLLVAIVLPRFYLWTTPDFPIEYKPILMTTYYWVFNIVLSILVYKYFEVPITKLRDKF